MVQNGLRGKLALLRFFFHVYMIDFMLFFGIVSLVKKNFSSRYFSFRDTDKVCFVHLWLDAFFIWLIKRHGMVQVGLRKKAVGPGVCYVNKNKKYL